MSPFKPFSRFRVSLTLKFILVMFVLVLMSSAAFGVYFVAREMTLLQNHLKNQTKSLADTCSLFFESSIDSFDLSFLQRLADQMVENEEVVSCSFLGRDGRRLAHAVKKGEPPSAMLSYHFSQPIRSRQGSLAGFLDLGFSLAHLNDRLRQLRRNILFLSLSVIGIGSLLTASLTRIFLRPIKKLVRATESVREGELAQTVNIQSRDEIGDLANAFNQMTFQLKESRGDLEKKVEERTRQLADNIEELNRAKTSTLKMLEDLQSAKGELERINQSLKEMDEAKMKFIAIASHELKTPLTAIKANIDFVLSEKEGKIPDPWKSYLLTIQRNTNRIHGTMDQMLDISRIRSGRLLLEREAIVLSDVVGGYVNEMKPIDKNLTIQVDIPGDLLVYADRNRLHDIFTNLLSNAFKFTPDGGQISIRASRKENFILHTIQDTGTGIPEDEIEKIFEEFYQVDGSSKYGGTGLGLAITKRVVEEHGGAIWAESRPGEGAAFSFTLPVPQENEDARSIGS